MPKKNVKSSSGQAKNRSTPASKSGDETTTKNGAETGSSAANATVPVNAAAAAANIKNLQAALEALTLRAAASAPTAPKSNEIAKNKVYKFWSTQPVPKLDEEINENREIEEDKKTDELRKEPYPLPDGFRWDSIDIENADQLKELYTLLNRNYVEDDDEMFRFDYQPDFLKWALQPPDWVADWHVGVRVTTSNALVGFISAIPVLVRVQTKTKKMVEINFLCVHKKLRSKRLTPVLISEITRRVNLTGVFQAVYTAGVVLPKPVVTCRYWHRSLNPRKLVDVKFSHLSRNMTIQRLCRLNKLPEHVAGSGFRPLADADVPQAMALVNRYLEKFTLVPVFNETEFRHWFLPRTNIINSFVICNDSADATRITDFISFYTLPSTVVQHPVHKALKIAYSFYNVAGTLTWPQLMTDALVTAKSMDFDAFNALDLMDNGQFLEQLKFGVGDGFLRYYLFNWKCPKMEPQQNGLILQ